MDESAPISDIAFTPAVKAIQTRKRSRDMCAQLQWRSKITGDLAAFIALQTSCFLATANAQGQPYIQHRGGPAGFLRVVDETTLAFADFIGNRQYITQGNLSESAKAHLFLIDYCARQRIKIWGEAKVVSDDPLFVASLMPEGYRARAMEAIIFSVKAWDVNCPKHIPLRAEADEVAAALAQKDAQIAALEAEIARLTHRA